SIRATEIKVSVGRDCAMAQLDPTGHSVALHFGAASGNFGGGGGGGGYLETRAGTGEFVAVVGIFIARISGSDFDSIAQFCLSVGAVGPEFCSVLNGFGGDANGHGIEVAIHARHRCGEKEP